MISKILNILLNHPIGVTMFFVAITVIGIICFSLISIELSPHIELPKLTVTTSWRNTSAVTMETNITAPIESAVRGLRGVSKITSRTYEGYSSIKIDFEKDADLQLAELELNEKISLLKKQFPQGVSWPSIRRSVPREMRSFEGFMRYQLIGDMSASELQRVAEEKLLIPLSSLQGIDDVDIWGGTDEIVNIELNPEAIRRYDISQNDLNAFNASLAAQTVHVGKVYDHNEYKNIQLVTRHDNLASLKNIIIKRLTSGRIIKLTDIAIINKMDTSPTSIVRINGCNLVTVNLNKVPGVNLIKTAKQVESKIAQLREMLPSQLKLIKSEDKSQKLKEELDTLKKRSLISTIFIALLLFVIFKRIHTAIIIICSIVLSILCAISIFYFSGYTINILTLAGFTIGFGILVDNSIVVYDNIQRKLSDIQFPDFNVEDRKSRIVEGTVEMIQPLVASNLTTVGAFIPVIFLSPDLQMYFKPFVIGLGLTIIISLFISFLLIPTFSLHQPFKNRLSANKNRESRFITGYKHLLHFAMHHKKWTLIIILWLFGLPVWLLPDRIDEQKKTNEQHRQVIRKKPEMQKITNRKHYEALVLSENLSKQEPASKQSTEKTDSQQSAPETPNPMTNWLIRSYNATWGNHYFTQKVKPVLFSIFGGASYLFFRKVNKTGLFKIREDTYIQISIRMPRSLTIENMNQVCLDFENDLRMYAAKIKKVSSYIYNKQRGNIRIDFNETFENSSFAYELYQHLVRKAGNIGSANISITGHGDVFSSGGGGSAFSHYGLKISGTNYNHVHMIAEKISKNLSHIKRVQNIDIDSNSRRIEPRYEVVCNPSRSQLPVYHIDNSIISSDLRNYLNVESKLSITLNSEQLNATIKHRDAAKNDIRLLPDYYVQHEKKARFKNIAAISKRRVLPSIQRENQRYMRMVNYDYIGPIGYGYKVVEKIIDDIDIPYGYTVEPDQGGGFMREDSQSQLLSIILLAVLIVFSISAALFESWTKPFLIILAIPLSVIGLFYSFYFFDAVFDEGGYASVILLVGIVVNNAIILVKHISNHLEYNAVHGYSLENITSRTSLIVKAASERVRPVLLTSITTIVGLLPLVIYETTESMWYPLAVGVIGGLLLSSILVLVVIPVCMDNR